jgi:hypothetical protein
VYFDDHQKYFGISERIDNLLEHHRSQRAPSKNIVFLLRIEMSNRCFHDRYTKRRSIYLAWLGLIVRRVASDPQHCSYINEKNLRKEITAG